jgi:hypothetical protein
MCHDMAFGVSCVTDWLFIGGSIGAADQVRWLKAQGVTHVISAAIEHSDRDWCRKHGLGYCHVLWHDDSQFKRGGDFLRALSWVETQAALLAAAGKQVVLYVHCAMGYNRGPLLATFLLAAREALPADEAWARVKHSRPQAGSFDVLAYRQSCLLALARLTVNTVPESVAPALVRL